MNSLDKVHEIDDLSKITTHISLVKRGRPSTPKLMQPNRTNWDAVIW